MPEDPLADPCAPERRQLPAPVFDWTDRSLPALAGQTPRPHNRTEQAVLRSATVLLRELEAREAVHWTFVTLWPSGRCLWRDRRTGATRLE
jgi:hypothetical protein